MKKLLTTRDLWLIKLRATKHMDGASIFYQDVIAAANSSLQLLKENFLLKEKLFNIEQSLSEEDRILNIIDAKLDLAMLSNNKEDFLEINKSINNKVWTIIIQKKFGKTPQQRLRQSEIRRLKAAQKIANLHSEVNSLNKTIASLRQEVKILFATKADDPIQVLKNREDLIHLRAVVESKIKSNNSNVYRQALATVHKSFLDSLHEAWVRVSVSDSRAGKAERELDKIKESFKKKKNVSALIYNLRKKKRFKKLC